MALHDTIRARRKELGLSQEYLAEQLGISRQAVAKWEAGQSRPTAANLAALAAVLELPVSALVDPVGAQPLSSAHPGEKEKNIKWRLRRSGAYILLNTGWDGYSSGLYGIAPLYWLAILAAGLVLLFMTSVEREKQLKLQNMPKVQIALGALMLFSIFFSARLAPRAANWTTLSAIGPSHSALPDSTQFEILAGRVGAGRRP